MAHLDFAKFRTRFDKIVAAENPTWEVVGFLSPDNKVYPFGTDSKVLSTVFETLTSPIVGDIAKGFGYDIEGSAQTIYPDFTLTPKGVTPNATNPSRIAIDIKTTYRGFTSSGQLKPFRYTLGSYTSFLRSPTATKNITYPYAEYSDHWVVGFLYTRRPGTPAKVYWRKDAAKLICPYENVEYFVQDKYKIVGESPGSGNTANIGSFPTRSIDDLREGRGPFAQHGKTICDTYWRHYGRTAGTRQYNNVPEFLDWWGKQPTK